MENSSNHTSPFFAIVLGDRDREKKRVRLLLLLHHSVFVVPINLLQGGLNDRCELITAPIPLGLGVDGTERGLLAWIPHRIVSRGHHAVLRNPKGSFGWVGQTKRKELESGMSMRWPFTARFFICSRAEFQGAGRLQVITNAPFLGGLV